MGLSTSKSKTKTNEQRQTNERTQGTTLPIAPGYVGDLAEDFGGRLAAFGEMDPNQFVAGAAPLQQAAWANAGDLGAYRPQMNLASRNLSDLARSRPGMVQPHTMNPATVSLRGYDPPRPGPASLVSASGYQMPQLGSGTTYAVPRAGQPIRAQAGGYQNQMVGREAIDPATNAEASAAGGVDIGSRVGGFMNPWLNDVVNASLSEFDVDAGRRKAALQAAGARNGAFGGSRFGLAEAALEGDLARGRATLGAGLRAQGFDTASRLAAQEAGMDQQGDIFNAGNRTGVSLANAGAANARNLAQAEMNLRGSMFNTEGANRAAEFRAGSGNVAELANADAGNRFGLADLGIRADAARYGADTSNQFDLARAGFAAEAGRTNAGLRQQASLANQDATNRLSLADLATREGAARFTAEAGNTGALANQGARMQGGMFNASQRSAADALNANLGLQGNAQAIQASGMLADIANQYGAGTRADLATMAQLGDQQRAVEQAYAMAPLAQLDFMGRGLNAFPLAALVGQSVNGQSQGSMSGSGTSVTSQSPSLFNQMLGFAALNPFGFFGGGGGK